MSENGDIFSVYIKHICKENEGITCQGNVGRSSSAQFPITHCKKMRDATAR